MLFNTLFLDKLSKTQLQLRHLFILLLTTLLLSSCIDKEESTKNTIAKYIGTYSATAQEKYMDFGKSYVMKDTTYTDVKVEITQSGGNDNKLMVLVHLPNEEKRHYNGVTIIDDQLNYIFSSRGCGCTQSIKGQMQENVLVLSLYNYSAGVIDSRIDLKASKLD